MKETYYINKEYHTLVHVTYNTTQRTYEVVGSVNNQTERLSLAEFTERCKQRYESIRRAKIVKTLTEEYVIVVRSKSTPFSVFKRYRTHGDAYADAIRNCLPLVTYVRSANGTAIGLNTIRTVMIVSKYYKKDYALRRAFDREYNK